MCNFQAGIISFSVENGMITQVKTETALWYIIGSRTALNWVTSSLRSRHVFAFQSKYFWKVVLVYVGMYTYGCATHLSSLPSWLQYMILPILPTSKELNRDNYYGADFKCLLLLLQRNFINSFMFEVKVCLHIKLHYYDFDTFRLELDMLEIIKLTWNLSW